MPTRGRLSWTELETPLVPTRGRLSFAELETGIAPTRGQISWAELEAGAAPTRGRIAFAELEVVDVGGGEPTGDAMSGLSGFSSSLVTGACNDYLVRECVQ